MKKIILASKSPRRKELLKELGLDFIIYPSVIEEKVDSTIPTEQVPVELSKQKARNVAKRHKNSIIIAADTIVVLDDHILGKPVNKQNAKEMLTFLSGKTHKVITGLTIIDTSSNKQSSNSETSFVKLKNLSEQEIEDYIKTGEPFEAAGGYKVRGTYGKHLIEQTRGDISNIIGLPTLLKNELKQFGVIV